MRKWKLDGDGSYNTDNSVDGGSSYIGEYGSAIVRNAFTKAGNEIMPSFDGSTMIGNNGTCHAIFGLVDRNIN